MLIHLPKILVIFPLMAGHMPILYLPVKDQPPDSGTWIVSQHHKQAGEILLCACLHHLQHMELYQMQSVYITNKTYIYIKL